MQTESISEQTLGESVDKYAEESVSANFVCEEETEVSSNTVNMEVEKADAERTVGNRSGIDGDLEWSIDAEGFDTTMKSMFASCKNLSDIGIDGTGK